MNKSPTTITGIFIGILIFAAIANIGLFVGVILADILQLHEGIAIILLVVSGCIIPFIAGRKAERLTSGHINGVLSPEKEHFFKKVKRFLYGMVIGGGVFGFLAEYGLENDNSFLFALIGFPLLMGTFLSLGIPFLNKQIKGLVADVKNNNDKTNYQKPISMKKSSSLMPKWVLNRIIAPVIVGLILGSITFLITGDFQTGSNVSIVSIPINWVVSDS